MGLLGTTMLNNIKILHLESTDSCNAACPLCLRETDSTFNKPGNQHLTVDKIRETICPDFIKNLDKMFMCGNYGDPAAGKHTLDIFRYFRSINPGITLGMNTNGSLRTISWWEELSLIFTGDSDYVVWSIDGLEDTNHIYRVNTSWGKIMENSAAFIAGGGNAHWDMIAFSHNEHQVDDAEKMAKALGFSWFRVKVSKRVFTGNTIRPSKNWIAPVIEQGSISCNALNEMSIYMSAHGIVYPCCWLGSTNFTIAEFDDIQRSWVTIAPNKKCSDNCATNLSAVSKFSNQWQREVELK